MLLKYSVYYPSTELPPGFEFLCGKPKNTCAKVIAFVTDEANPTTPLLNSASDAVKASTVDCGRYVGAVVGTLRHFNFENPDWVFDIEIPDEAILDQLAFQNCFLCQVRIYDCETQAIFNQLN